MANTSDKKHNKASNGAFAKNNAAKEFDEIAEIAKAQSGDDVARNRIIERYIPLIKSIARSFNIVAAMVDVEDLTLAGGLALSNAINAYKIDRDASFKTFAATCVRNRMLDEIRKKHDSTYISDLPLEPEGYGKNRDPETLYLENEGLDLLMSAIKATLSPIEEQALFLYLDAMSYEEIAKQLGIEKKKVDNAIYSARKKLKKLLEQNKDD